MVSTEKLVFGELKSLYEKHVTGTCKEIGERYRGLQEIEEQLFVGFIFIFYLMPDIMTSRFTKN